MFNQQLPFCFIGEALTTNIKDSYRMGVELTAGWAQPTTSFLLHIAFL